MYAILAVEDALGRALGEKILCEHDIGTTQVLGLQGNSWLKANAVRLNKASLRIPVLMLTDLDTLKKCPENLVETYCPGNRTDNFLLRVCVVEAESWVLADRLRFAKFIGVGQQKITMEPDTLAEPKEHLVRLASKGTKRSVVADLVPARGSTAKVGPAYNPRLTTFVFNEWSVADACKNSPSLRRAVDAVARLGRKLAGRSKPKSAH